MKTSLALLVALALELNASANTRQVTVSGQCNRMSTPDRGAVTLTAEVKSADLGTASKRATDIYERTRTAVKKLALADESLSTTEYNMGEIREWENNKQVSKGFRARLALRVETSDVKRLGEVVRLATQEGVREVSALQNFLSDEKRVREHAACLKLAAENARAKADEVARGLDAKVGKPLDIQELAAESTPPMPMAKMAMAGGAELRDQAQATIEGGQQAISVNVRVSFELKD